MQRDRRTTPGSEPNPLGFMLGCGLVGLWLFGFAHIGEPMERHHEINLQPGTRTRLQVKQGDRVTIEITGAGHIKITPTTGQGNRYRVTAVGNAVDVEALTTAE